MIDIEHTFKNDAPKEEDTSTKDVEVGTIELQHIVRAVGWLLLIDAVQDDDVDQYFSSDGCPINDVG